MSKINFIFDRITGNNWIKEKINDTVVFNPVFPVNPVKKYENDSVREFTPFQMTKYAFLSQSQSQSQSNLVQIVIMIGIEIVKTTPQIPYFDRKFGSLECII